MLIAISLKSIDSSNVTIPGKLCGRPGGPNRNEDVTDSNRITVPCASNDQTFHDDETPHSSTVIQSRSPHNYHFCQLAVSLCRPSPLDKLYHFLHSLF